MKNISIVIPKYQTGYTHNVIVSTVNFLIEAFGTKLPRLGNSLNNTQTSRLKSSMPRQSLIEKIMVLITSEEIGFITFNLQNGEVWLDGAYHSEGTISYNYNSSIYRMANFNQIIDAEKAIRQLHAKWDFVFKGVRVTRDENGVVEMNPTDLLKEVKAEVERRTAAGE